MLNLTMEPTSPPRRASPSVATFAGITSVLVADQNRMHAEGVGLICARLFPGAQVAFTTTGTETLERLRQAPADILILGLVFGDLDGIELLNRINQEHLAAHILIISSQWEEHMLLSLRTARFEGAFDTSSESVGMLGEALALVLQGAGYISRSLRRYLIDDLPATRAARELTAAELRVLRVIGDGSDNQEAGEKLGLSAATVQTHRRNIMRKLRVSTSAKLVCEAMRLGLVRLTPAIPPAGRSRPAAGAAGFTQSLPKLG